ncbi:Extradiol ring-cleavage dioxygenase, class III enzyme, subunit B [Cladochytrium replicatum]|nr:Extradiol ring-cleavage dioxygenase, class III enzyme, subunit B [Cladochytrium replicatum]
MTRAPAIFVPHGGGPLPVLGDPAHKPLVNFLSGKLNRILTAHRPRAIVLVTAHWESRIVNISSAPKHNLLYDYYGFPPEAYKLKYDAPGDPEVARLVHQTLKSAGIPSTLNDKRGWDHGLFVPLSLALPAQETPIIQLSLLASLDPASHIALGRALSPLRDSNIAILGSGMSFHNMSAIFSTPSQKDSALAIDFDADLTRACAVEGVEGRCKALQGWEMMKGARWCHPREEHLMPLLVVAGAGAEGEAGKKLIEWDFGGLRVSGFGFGVEERAGKVPVERKGEEL